MEPKVRANSAVALALKALSTSDRLEFREVSEYASTTDLVAWLASRGQIVEFRAVEYWVKASQKHTQRSLKLNKRLKTYRRISPRDAMVFAMGVSADALITFIDELDSELVPVSEERRSEIEARIPGLIRELRSAASSVQESSYIRDRDELQRIGAEIVGSELMLTFKDTPLEEPLKEALKGALAKIEGR
jgi:hypothetical protein